ncbi:MAG: glycosyltransferase [Nocardioidaceae bacterium]
MTPDLVTVVVPTRNNERTIEACLRSVAGQSHPEVELVVVDNHSTDLTQSIAHRYAGSVLVAGPERSAQRNLGLDQARGSWFLWLDSDMVLPPECLATALDTADRLAVDAVALPERTVGDGFWTACRALERSCYLDDPWLHNPRLVRTGLMRELGGFDLSMSGPEDADLRHKIRATGREIALAPVLVDHDEGRLTLREVMVKRYYYGRSIPSFMEANRGAAVSQGRTILEAYVRNRRRLGRDPVHAVGMVGMRAAEAVAYGVGARRGSRDARDAGDAGDAGDGGSRS